MRRWSFESTGLGRLGDQQRGSQPGGQELHKVLEKESKSPGQCFTDRVVTVARIKKKSKLSRQLDFWGRRWSRAIKIMTYSNFAIFSTIHFLATKMGSCGGKNIRNMQKT